MVADGSIAGDVYEASVTQLMRLFRRALVALLPLAREAAWYPESDNPHVLWESTVQHLFDCFVRQPIEFGVPSGTSAPRMKRLGDTTWHRGAWITPTPEDPRLAVLDIGDPARIPNELTVARVGTIAGLRGEPESFIWDEHTEFVFVRRSASGLEIFPGVAAID